MSDFLSGLFHWVEDNYLPYGHYNFPLLESISKDNELHHYYPREILFNSYLEHYTYTTPIILIIFTLIYMIEPSILQKHSFFFICLFIFSASSNVFHHISHYRDCELGWLNNWFYKNTIFNNHEHHSLHHQHPKTNYCAILNVNNYFLDLINFWSYLEHIIQIIFNITPIRKLAYNDYSDIFTSLHIHNNLSCPAIVTKDDLSMLRDILEKKYNN